MLNLIGKQKNVVFPHSHPSVKIGKPPPLIWKQVKLGLGAMRRLFEFRLATRNTESNFKKRLVPQKPFGGRFEAEILRYYGIW